MMLLLFLLGGVSWKLLSSDMLTWIDLDFVEHFNVLSSAVEDQVIMGKHDSFWISSGTARVDKGATHAWFLAINYILHDVIVYSSA